MRINNINTQVKLTTRNNSNNFKYNNLNQSSKKEEQITFKGAFLVQAKKVIRKIIGSKKQLITGEEVKNIQKIKNTPIAEAPSATSKLKDSTEPVKWEIRESINSQPFDNSNENNNVSSTETTKPKSTNLLNLIG